MNKTMEWVRKKCWPLTKTRWAVLATVLYIGVIGSIRYDALQLIWCGKLNELGDYLAGFFTPVAFLWLVVGYFLQKEEFGLQREELEETRKTLSTQVEVLKEQADAERRRVMPSLSLREIGGFGQGRSFEIRNYGGPARKLVFFSVEEEGVQERNQLETNEVYGFSAMFPANDRFPPPRFIHYTARYVSERHERFEQRWLITFTDLNLPVEIQEETAGPTLLEAD